MVICHCRAVSDAHIRKAIERGAVDVETVIRRCGAGSICGGCRPAIVALLTDGQPLATADIGGRTEPGI